MVVSLIACNSDARLFKKAKENFDLGEYEWAIRDVKPLADKNYRSAETNYLVAESYRLSNRIQFAEPYYQIAKEKGYIDPLISFHLAYAAKATGNYAETKKYLQEFIGTKPSREWSVKAEIELENLPSVEE